MLVFYAGYLFNSLASFKKILLGSPRLSCVLITKCNTWILKVLLSFCQSWYLFFWSGYNWLVPPAQDAQSSCSCSCLQTEFSVHDQVCYLLGNFDEFFLSSKEIHCYFYVTESFYNERKQFHPMTFLHLLR